MDTFSLPAFVWGKTSEQAGYHEIACHPHFPKAETWRILEQLKNDFSQFPDLSKIMMYAALCPVATPAGWLLCRLSDQGADQFQRPGTWRLEVGWCEAHVDTEQLKAWLLEYPYWQLSALSVAPVLQISSMTARYAAIERRLQPLTCTERILIGPHPPIQQQVFTQFCLAPELLPVYSPTRATVSLKSPPPVVVTKPAPTITPPKTTATKQLEVWSWGLIGGVALMGFVLGGGLIGALSSQNWLTSTTANVAPEISTTQALTPYLTHLMQSHIITYCKQHDCTELQQALRTGVPRLQLFWQHLPADAQAPVRDLWGQYATQTMPATALPTWQAWRASSWQLYQQLTVLSELDQQLLLQALQQQAVQYQQPLLTQPNLSLPWLTLADAQMLQRLQQILLSAEHYNTVVKTQLQRKAHANCAVTLPTLQYQICRYQQLLPASSATHFLMQQWQTQLKQLQQQLGSLNE